MDVHLDEHIVHRRGMMTIAFELDDGQVAHASIGLCLEVVEPEIQVDGESFGHAMIDEGDAVEEVLELGLQGVGAQGGRLDLTIDMGEERSLLEFSQDLRHQLIGLDGIVGDLHLHTFLARTTMIVLMLDFEESLSCIQIGSHPDLLSGFVTHFVSGVHLVVGRIEIDGMIARYTLTLLIGLHEIVMSSSLEEFYQLLEAYYVFRIRTIHQLNTHHLIQTDGLEVAERVLNCLYHFVLEIESGGRLLSHRRYNVLFLGQI